MLNRGSASRDHVCDLALAIQHVDRHEDDAESNAREKEVEKVDTVREVDAQPVAAREPARRERVRHAVGARVDLAERDRANAIGRVVLEPDAVAAADKRQIEEIPKLHVGIVSRAGGSRWRSASKKIRKRIRRKPLIRGSLSV